MRGDSSTCRANIQKVRPVSSIFVLLYFELMAIGTILILSGFIFKINLFNKKLYSRGIFILSELSELYYLNFVFEFWKFSNIHIFYDIKPSNYTKCALQLSA